ncbi:MAG: tRNA 2-thiouridine(34) synthase MnmA [Planctomycetota bacterium]
MRVVAALSGGVDSSVAALLLRQAGCDVVGVFMRNGVASAPGKEKSCCSAADARDAGRVADRLGIPFYAVDYADEFSRLIDHFAAEYRAGRTPNPCVLCNQDLKFGHLLRFAASIDAGGVATGHYARVVDGSLRRARDRHKDQTYYLFGVPRAALSQVRFPLGDLEKEEVRSLARDAGLATADKPESMEICFVTSGDYRDVVRARGGAGRPGRFVDEAGAELGRHGGVGGFTVGQRRGLPALGEPRFVKHIDAASGDVVLCARAGLASEGALVRGVNWLVDRPTAALRAEVKVRAQSPAVPARLESSEADTVQVRFDQPVAAVTPGQAAVFYDGDLVLGGGWID